MFEVAPQRYGYMPLICDTIKDTYLKDCCKRQAKNFNPEEAESCCEIIEYQIDSFDLAAIDDFLKLDLDLEPEYQAKLNSLLEKRFLELLNEDESCPFETFEPLIEQISTSSAEKPPSPGTK